MFIHANNVYQTRIGIVYLDEQYAYEILKCSGTSMNFVGQAKYKIKIINKTKCLTGKNPENSNNRQKRRAIFWIQISIMYEYCL